MNTGMLRVHGPEDLMPQMAYLPEVNIPHSFSAISNRSVLFATLAKKLKCTTKDIVVVRPVIDENRDFVIDLEFEFNIPIINGLKRSGKKIWYYPETKTWRYTPDCDYDIKLGEIFSPAVRYAVYLMKANQNKVFESQST